LDVYITEWGLQSYTDLLGRGVFTVQDYKTQLRPDIELLKTFPNPRAKFGNHLFWGNATDKSGNPIRGGFKMKWRNLGSGRVQLRLAVAIVGNQALLCHAWVKQNPATDQREIANFKRRMNIILQGRHTIRGGPL